MLKMYQRRICAAAVALLVLSACTQERALALKAGAEAFSAKATAAIDAVVALGIRANLGKAESEEVLIRRAREGLFAAQRTAPDKMDSAIGEAFVWIKEREQLRRSSYGDYDKLKMAYQEFVAAYTRLPEGSLFAAKEVACSAALGARLVGYMAAAGKALADSPVPLISETLESNAALKKAVAESLTSRNEQPFDAVVRSHVALLKEQQRVNAEAVDKLADAAEAGLVVLEMIDQYDTVSLTDLMHGLGQVLVVRDRLSGLSSRAQLERLDGVFNKLDSKPALAAALRLPLNQKPADCK
jgi:hypothetical protein